MIQDWFGYGAPSFPGSTLIPPVFGTIVFFWRRLAVPDRRVSRAPRAASRG